MVEFLKSADGEALWGDGLAMLLTAPPRQSALAAVGEVQAVLTADQGEASEVVKLSEGIYIVNPSGWGSLYIGFWPSLLVISHAKIRIANKITDIAADDNFSMLQRTILLQFTLLSE